MHRLNEEEAFNDVVESKILLLSIDFSRKQREQLMNYSPFTTLTQKPEDKAGKNV
jgi:hypothetical protein